MANIIKCECCGKEISENSITCMNCGHPINIPKTEILLAYQYNGETLNSPIFKDEVSKLDILKKVKKVKINQKTYKIVDFVCNAHDETIYVEVEDL